MLKNFSCIWKQSFKSQVFSPGVILQKSQSYFSSTSHFNNVQSVLSVVSESLIAAQPYDPLNHLKTSTIKKFDNETSALRTLFEENKDLYLDRAFYLANVKAAKNQYNKWTTLLPRVEPFYAIKCNPDNVLVKTLFNQGCKFDAASKAEIQLALDLGTHSNNILFANPVKNIVDIKFAAEKGVTKMTFDNVDELYKIAQYHPKSELILRLLVDDSHSVMPFGSKFGCPQQDVPTLLETAKQLGLHVIGTSFHGGSGCFNPAAYTKAIQLSKSVHDCAESLGLPKFTMVNIGGGFSSNNSPKILDKKVIPPFSEFAAEINRALEQYFPDPSIQVVAEIGRFFATPFQTLFTVIHGKRKQMVTNSLGEKEQKIMYYIVNGTYDAFNCIVNDHQSPIPIIVNDYLQESTIAKNHTFPFVNRQLCFRDLFPSITFPQKQLQLARQLKTESINQQQKQSQYKSSLMGFSCDSGDQIAKEVWLKELQIGDYLMFPNMGAYTNSAGSKFNGMEQATTIYYEA